MRDKVLGLRGTGRGRRAGKVVAAADEARLGGARVVRAEAGVRVRGALRGLPT